MFRYFVSPHYIQYTVAFIFTGKINIQNLLMDCDILYDTKHQKKEIIALNIKYLYPQRKKVQFVKRTNVVQMFVSTFEEANCFLYIAAGQMRKSNKKNEGCFLWDSYCLHWTTLSQEVLHPCYQVFTLRISNYVSVFFCLSEGQTSNSSSWQSDLILTSIFYHIWYWWWEWG